MAVVPDIPYLLLKCIPSQIHFLRQGEDNERRRQFEVDNVTGYRVVTIKKIREGILKGDLTPLININDVPDYCHFIAGLIDSPDLIDLQYPPTSNISLYLIVIAIVLVAYYMFRRK